MLMDSSTLGNGFKAKCRDMENFSGTKEKLDMKENLKRGNFMEGEHSIMEVLILLEELTQEMNPMKVLFGCRRIIGKNMKETLKMMLEKAKGLCIFVLETGWETSKMGSPMEKEYLYMQTGGESKENGEMGF